MLTTERWRLEENTRFGCASGAKSNDAAKHKGILYHRRLYNTLRLHVAVSMPGLRLLVEPWFQAIESKTLRSPDAVLVDDLKRRAIVIEAKLNWKDGRDKKLLDEYLSIVRSALALEQTKPLLITGNVRGLQHKPLTGLSRITEAWDWLPGQPTPVALVL